MKFSGEYRVNANDMDVNSIVSASGVLRFMQDAAYSQMEEDGMSYGTLVEEYGVAFILSKIRMSLYAPLYSHDRILGESWACPSRGATFLRCHRILRGTETIAEAVSSWALVGVADKRLHRVGEIALPYGEEEPLTPDSPSRMKIPPQLPLSLVGERTVAYEDIDSNGHMNNTRYPDMLCDFTDGILSRRVVGLSMSFLHEATFGHTLKVYRVDRGEEHLFRTVDADGVTCLEARMLTEPIRELQ